MLKKILLFACSRPRVASATSWRPHGDIDRRVYLTTLFFFLFLTAVKLALNQFRHGRHLSDTVHALLDTAELFSDWPSGSFPLQLLAEQLTIGSKKIKVAVVRSSYWRKGRVTNDATTTWCSMAQPASDDPSFSKTVLSRLDIDIKGTFDYKKFRTLCIRLFGASETEEHEWRAREIFERFDANADGALTDEELHK